MSITKSKIASPANTKVNFMKAVILSIIVSLWAASVSAQEQASPPKPTVTVSRSLISEVVDRVPVSGSLVAREEVLVNPQVNGFEIKTINVDVGDLVKTGDVLAELNQSTLRAQFEQSEAEVARAAAAVQQAGSQIESAEASLIQAAAALERAQKLNRSGNLAQSTLDQNIASEGAARASLSSAENGLAVAKAQLKYAESQRDLATLNLERSKITATVDGLIAARMAKVGAIASSGDEPMFRIFRDGEIEMQADVIETALGTVEVGDAAELSVSGIGPIPGKVRLIAPSVDPVTRLGTVKVALGDSPLLRSGVYAGGWIITDRHQAITVPSTAVLSDANGSYVLVVESDTIARRPVVAGLIWKNQREVISGLEAGENVVAKSGAFFVDGDVINPILDSASSERGEAK